MKMMLLKTGMLIGGAGVLGYMYLKKHPEVVCKAKQTIKDTSKKVYDMMDDAMTI